MTAYGEIELIGPTTGYGRSATFRRPLYSSTTVLAPLLVDPDQGRYIDTNGGQQAAAEPLTLRLEDVGDNEIVRNAGLEGEGLLSARPWEPVHRFQRA